MEPVIFRPARPALRNGDRKFKPKALRAMAFTCSLSAAASLATTSEVGKARTLGEHRKLDPVPSPAVDATMLKARNAVHPAWS
jgi:hypothetical protein